MTSAEKFLIEMGNVDDEFIEEAMNYTMKKKFNFKPIIAVAACAAFALAAVPVAHHFANINIDHTSGTTSTTTPVLGASGKFTVLYAGGSDGNALLEAGQKVETEFDGLDTNFMDKSKVGTTKTVEIAGNTWTGVYQDSTASDYYRDDTDNYFVEVDNKKVTFSINRYTGVCTKFYVADENPVTEKEVTRDECYANAIEHLKLYVDDIENYELKSEYDRGGRLGYLFRLYRMVNGIKTSDCIDIRVKNTGEVFGHSLYSIGEMKNIDISEINTANLRTAVTDKVNTLYKNYRNINQSEDDVMLSKLEDGSYIFEYSVSVEATDTETGKTRRDYQKFIVEID